MAVHPPPFRSSTNVWPPRKPARCHKELPPHSPTHHRKATPRRAAWLHGARAALERQSELPQPLSDRLLAGPQIVRFKLNVASRHVGLGQRVVH